jgi:peptidoglycan/xylan/chitin deacetylase (PgdA/CDA1 family)
MTPQRILLVSDARPSRTWRLANRITREVAGVEICGIVQRPLGKLPLTQQMIAAGRTDLCLRPSPWFSNVTPWFRRTFERLIHSALWFIHGCPGGTNPTQFATENSIREGAGFSLLLANDFDSAEVVTFVNSEQPDLAILIGETTLNSGLLKVPRCGWIRARQNLVQDARGKSHGIAIAIELLERNSDCAVNIAQLKLPRQTYDGLVGRTLKADLISDDLILQSIAQVLKGTMAEAADAVSEWMQHLFSPYLEQLERAPVELSQSQQGPSRHRPTWKLVFHTLLLCSPLIVVRNWHRRLRRRYPITILTHHLVSDRSHRMAISTESFWRRICFLRRHYRIVSLRDAVELLESGRVEAPTVVLTFDDGYADNFVGLRAVAEEAGIPVTLFIATEQVETQQEFQHDLENGIHGSLPLTWEQIRYWGRERVEFGSHTRTHFDCGSTDKTKLEYEILGSRCDLERRLDKPAEFFAFPFGQQENMSSQALELARTCYRHFVSGFGGENYCGKQKNRQHLLRKNLYTNAWELELDLQSSFDLGDKIKQKFHVRQAALRGVPSHGCVLSAATAGKTQLD